LISQTFNPTLFLGDGSQSTLLIPWLGTISDMDNIKWSRTGLGLVKNGPGDYGGYFINYKEGYQVVFDYIRNIYLRHSATGQWCDWRRV